MSKKNLNINIIIDMRHIATICRGGFGTVAHNDFLGFAASFRM